VIEPESVDCIVTSPPYYGLRSYSSETIQIFGGDKNCNHNWVKYKGNFDKRNSLFEESPNEFCDKCSAFRCQLGLEPTVDLYISHLVMIFSGLKRVLKNEGTCFVNIGDTYLNNGNLGMVPYRLAIRLQDDGWILRNIIIWNKRIAYKEENHWESKGNGLPESVDNRFAKSTEVVLFLTKIKSGYYFDINALKLDWKEESIERLQRGISDSHKYSKLPLYGGGGGLNKSRPHIEKYTGKLKPIAEKLSSMRARTNRMCDEINTGAISASSIYWNSFYRGYEKDEETPEVQFVQWLRNEVQNAGIESKLEQLFGVYLWRNWLRRDRPGVIMPTIEQWNIVKKLLGYENTPWDWLIKKHGYRRPPDSFLINTQSRPESHFATFPDDLVSILVLHGCPEDGIVLDPFGGIGTTGIVAYELKRRWICVEPVSDFIQIAIRKLKENTAQDFLPIRVKK